MLSGEFTAGDTVVVDIEDNDVVFNKKETVEVSKTDKAVVSG
jgi:hypothetical protein